MLPLLVFTSVVLAAASGNPDRYLVWPPPRSAVSTTGTRPLSASPLSIEFDSLTDARAASSPRLATAVARFVSRVERLRGSGSGSGSGGPPSDAAAAPLSSVSLLVRSGDETLGGDTDYSYTLSFDAHGPATITAPSIYGAIYGLESLVQLVQPGANGALSLSRASVRMDDAPAFNWRGLMLDAGRRFFPMGSVLDTLDTMLAAKLNVLHLHVSDECRFGIESKLYPNLTDALTGILAGHYTQLDISVMIAEAGSRGIRVVPEFDVPGHARGFRPIKAEGAVFCDLGDTQSQLYGDPANSTLNVLKNVLNEMAGLFEDEVFHVGCDETRVVGPCTTESTFELERQVLNYLEGPTVNKTTAGWEEVLFDAGAATNRTIVYAWSRDTPANVIDMGRRCVDAQSEYFYLTYAPGAYPKGWQSLWYGIGTSLTPQQLPMLLGGEMSMWTDTYCYIDECGAFNGANPVGAQLFPPDMDSPWATSVAGMIWPRAFVGAAAFWNYNSSVTSQDPDFVDAVWSINDRVIALGGQSCPSRCVCDQLTACGVPYVPPPPPPLGTLEVQACTASAAQLWVLDAKTGFLSSAVNTSLCVQDPGSEVYPLILTPCSSTASSPFHWQVSGVRGGGEAAPEWLVSTASGDCVDRRVADNALGTYACGSGSGLNQTNQNFWPPAAPTVPSPILSAAGGCVTALIKPMK